MIYFQISSYSSLSVTHFYCRQSPNHTTSNLLCLAAPQYTYQYNRFSCMSNQTNFNQSVHLQKSRVQKLNIPRTPSTQQIKSQHGRYTEHLDINKTDKKRLFQDGGIQVSVLMQQNKQLLAENREMAYAIHERNKAIDEWQRKYNRKIGETQSLLKAVEQERSRFVAQVFSHKEETQRQIACLEQQISNLHNQKQRLQIQSNRERRKQAELVEKERKQELQLLSKQYKESLTVMQAEHDKLKKSLEEKHNSLQLMRLEHKQQLQKLKTEVSRNQQQVKHEQHLRRLELAQSKQYYEDKIQQIHLDHRRHQELFFAEHQNQIKKLQDQISSLQQREQKMQEQQVHIKSQLQTNQQSQVYYQLKMTTQIEETRRIAKEQLKSDKQALQSILNQHHQITEATYAEQLTQMQKQNQYLQQIILAKTESLHKVYDEFDLLRNRYAFQLQEYEKIISQLHQSIYCKEESNMVQNELLKIKLTQLREADIKGLTSIHQHQIRLLTQQLADKQASLVLKRQKLHLQLMMKSEMREKFEVQIAKYKSELASLNSKLSDLQVQLHASDAQRLQKLRQQQLQSAQAERYNLKLDNFRSDQLQQLQNIITSKDLQIQQLESKIKLLKDHKMLQKNQKEQEIIELAEQNSLKLLERQAEISKLSSELEKLKLILQTQKQEFQQNIALLNDQHSQEMQNITQEYNTNNLTNSQQMTALKDLNRNLTLELNVLKERLEEGIDKAEENYKKIRQHHQMISNREKVELENFYLQKLKQKDSSIEQITHRNSQISSDLNDARQNYAELQKKLEVLIESQAGLRDLQRKVMNIGKQNSKIAGLRAVCK